MNLAGLIKESIVDGPGLRLVIFTQGCPHKCKGCHNPETHEYKEVSQYGVDEIMGLIKKDPLLDGVTISGGEPFSECNYKDIIELVSRIKEETTLNIIMYTGYTLEEIYEICPKDVWNIIKEKVDYLVDGPFILNKQSLDCKFRGSTNQRFINLKTGECMYTEYPEKLELR